MTERTEQRISIKFCFNLGKNCAETIEMLQKAFKGECMGEAQFKEWYRRYKSGRTSVDSDPRSDRHSTGTSSDNVECVCVAVEQDRRLTVRQLEDELKIPKSTVWRISTENLGMTPHRLDDKETVETNGTNALKAITKSDFQESFNKWKHRYKRLVQSNG
ncbi:protein GVQW3-like [Belonocnema kinseyi]|uniref:protein GVQW3-like n=1 Tax=Belonocnema kinseyi TaxID=2817044 RepID=UPI00143D6712|nr:protein GVQW3-like [Belonocnema kinseyi]